MDEITRTLHRVQSHRNKRKGNLHKKRDDDEQSACSVLSDDSDLSIINGLRANHPTKRVPSTPRSI